MQNKHFFEFLYRDLRSTLVLHRSLVFSPEQWQKFSGSSGGGLFSSRDKSLKEVDKTLKDYQACVHVSMDMMRHCHIICESDGTAGATNTIGFGFPGFDGQTFMVGQYACVTAWYLFEQSGILSFGQDTWEGSLSSTSPSKELMQSSPDVSSLYESDEIERAKKIMHAASLEVLHNLYLAQYMSNCIKDLKDKKVEWGEILAGIANKETYPQNQEHAKTWEGVRYWFNSSKTQISKILQNTIHHFDSLDRREEEGLDISFQTCFNNRLLFTPERFLAFLRVITSARSRSLQMVVHAISKWLTDHPKGKKPKNYAEVKSLKDLAQQEMKVLQEFSWNLPEEDEEQEGGWSFSRNTAAPETPKPDPVPARQQAPPPPPPEDDEDEDELRQFRETLVPAFKKSSVAPRSVVELDVAKQGMVEIRTRHLALWKKRWFVLQDQFLYSFKTQADAQSNVDPVEVLDLCLFSGVSASNLSSTAFNLASSDDSRTILATSKQECADWIRAVSAVLETFGSMTVGVNWKMLSDLGSVFGCQLTEEQAKILSPAMGEVFTRWGIKTPLMQKLSLIHI